MQTRPVIGRTLAIFISAILIVVTSERLTAQANPAASKKADLAVYGAYSRVTPDYGPEHNNGAMFGVDYTRYMHWFVTPSLELRGKVAPGPNVGQRTFGGGIRVERQFLNFHPYADFLISSGTFTFTHPTIDVRGKLYTSDNSIVYSTGFGVDYDVTRTLAGRFDYQFEHWTLGTNQTFTPRILSIGVVYRIPFRAFQSH
jgi:hypothetical protein